MSASPITHIDGASDREALEPDDDCCAAEQAGRDLWLVARTSRPVYLFACLSPEQRGQV